MNTECMVSVICYTYNHERYIKKCLDSLVAQDTSFNYEIIIHDDASTDKTAKIISDYHKKYPDIIVPIFQKENLYSKGISSWENYIFPRIRGKYIAICEGDDFWVSNHKLQKQVDFLEKHPNYTLCGHSAYYANEDGSLIDNQYFNYGNGERDLTVDDLISGWSMATNSMVFLTKARGANPIPFRGNALNGDLSIMIYVALQGKVHFFDELMSAYRKVSIGSVTWKIRKNKDMNIETTSRYIEMMERLDDYTKGKYHISIKKKIDKSLFDICLIRGDRKKARSYLDLYSKLSKSKKIKLWIKSIIPHTKKCIK